MSIVKDSSFFDNKIEGCASDQHQYILVIAESARMLAQAASLGGFKPLVIDLWNDQDTQRYAKDIQLVPSLAREFLLPAVGYFIKRYPVSGVVYGSGFEQHSDSLIYLQKNLILLGNAPEMFNELQDKPAFFSLLKKLQIPYPEVAFNKPEQPGSWLVKPMRGQGGRDIRRYRGEATELVMYWQKYQEGLLHSVLFLADGKLSQVVGFNQQWTTSLNNDEEFIFSGIINSTDLSVKQKAKISGWLNRLVPKFSLKGLNSLDFIQYGEISYVLEINPRPPASMQLYDTNLFVRHIKACQGELLDYEAVQHGCNGYQVIYAAQDTQIPEGFAWLEGSQDIPSAGSIISPSQPICSIISHQNEPHAVLEQLQAKQTVIINQLNRFQSHGI